MSQQNRSAQRRPANVVPNLKQESQIDGIQEQFESGVNDLQEPQVDPEQSVQSKMELLDRYSHLLEDLNVEYADTTQAYTNLETDIMNREIACGRLMRQHLEIGEQIRLQKQSISTQREELRRTQAKREQTLKQKDMVVKKIATLASSSST